MIRKITSYVSSSAPGYMDMRPRRWSYYLLCVLACSLLIQSTKVKAASFDCSKSSTEVERLICATPTLSRLDVMLDGAYHSALAASKTPDKLREEQLAWIKDRNYCKNVKCLESDYCDRLEVLYLSDGPEHAASRGALEGYGATRHDIPNVVDILRMADKVESESVIKNAPMCDAFVEAVRSGNGVKMLPPAVNNARLDDPRLKPYLKDCDKNSMRYGSIMVPYSIHGEHIMGESGRVESPYDDYAVWKLPECGDDCFLLYHGPSYINVEHSLSHYVDEGPYWGGDGGGFNIFVLDKCQRRAGVNVPYFPEPGSTPSLVRQSLFVQFENKRYLVVTGDLGGGSHESNIRTVIYGIKHDGHFTYQCSFNVKN